jgi:hypothetical protein
MDFSASIIFPSGEDSTTLPVLRYVRQRTWILRAGRNIVSFEQRVTLVRHLYPNIKMADRYKRLRFGASPAEHAQGSSLFTHCRILG